VLFLLKALIQSSLGRVGLSSYWLKPALPVVSKGPDSAEQASGSNAQQITLSSAPAVGFNKVCRLLQSPGNKGTQ
jgi:hypothetical protein